jgi:hypothetical protein
MDLTNISVYKNGNIQLETENVGLSLACNYSAVLQMRGRGRPAIHKVCGQADDKADAVLLDSY